MQWNGSIWTNRTIACNGMNSKSRDGMPGITQLGDGSWMLAYEANNMTNYPFVLRYKISADGLNWTTDTSAASIGTAFYVPKKTGRKASGAILVTLPDGRVACGFQTDEDAAFADDLVCSMRVMVTKDSNPQNWGVSGWGKVYDPFKTPADKYSLWNGLSLHKNYLIAATSTNYPDNSILTQRAYIY